MGWLFTYKPRGESMKEFFSKEFNGENGQVLDVALVNFREAYIAYQLGDEVIALVCLVDYDNNSYYNVGYKDMDETMGPRYYNCPKRILEKLTPTQNEYAREWREACWQRHQEKEAKRVSDGDQVRFAHPITFTNGYFGDTFTVIKNGRKVRFSDGYDLYRISNWQNRDFQIIKGEC